MQNYKMDDRLKRVAKLLAQSMIETQIDHNFGVYPLATNSSYFSIILLRNSLHKGRDISKPSP